MRHRGEPSRCGDRRGLLNFGQTGRFEVRTVHAAGRSNVRRNPAAATKRFEGLPEILEALFIVCDPGSSRQSGSQLSTFRQVVVPSLRLTHQFVSTTASIACRSACKSGAARAVVNAATSTATGGCACLPARTYTIRVTETGKEST
jgi:hypothetical protein